MSTPLPLQNDPQDIAIGPDGDLILDEEGLRWVSGIDAVVQAVRIRLLMFRGEWSLNLDIGIPYFEELVGDASKRPGVEDRARAAFGAAILNVPGVLSILQLDVRVNASTRKMIVTWQARCAFGDTPVVEIEVT